MKKVTSRGLAMFSENQNKAESEKEDGNEQKNQYRH